MSHLTNKDHPFDRLAKRLAGGFTRRAALQHLTRGGVAAALFTAWGREQPAVAQGGATTAGAGAAVPGTAPQTCAVMFEATVRQGPSAGLVLQGYFGGTLAETGEFLQGVLILLDGTRLALTGQANGHAINLVIQLGPGRSLYGVGTLDHDVRMCQGKMGGVFTGPLPGDLGDWSTPRPLEYCDPIETAPTPTSSHCPTLGGEFSIRSPIS